MTEIEMIIKTIESCGSMYKAVHFAVKRTQELVEKESLLLLPEYNMDQPAVSPFAVPALQLKGWFLK